MKKKQEIPEEIREALKGAESEQPTEDSAESTAEQTSESEAEQKSAEEPKAAGIAEQDPEEEPVKLAEDVAEFHALFPSVKADEIPGEVWDRVETGESLTAAFAVHFVKVMRENARIEAKNAENEKTAPPPVRQDGKEESYFSPEAVQAMSREEVRKHYQEILRSMDHWN